MSILISVVVPAYNEEKLIGLCLESLKNQDFGRKHYEVIVVDNQSTDKTPELLKESFVKHVKEPKKGVSFAVKKGFLYASGQIVATTDADTIVNPSWLSNIFKAFKDHPEAAIVGGRLIFAPKNFLSCFFSLFLNYIGGVALKTTGGSNFAIRKDIYFRIGGVRKDINFNFDTDLCFRAKKVGKSIFLLNNPVVTSSRHYKGKEGFKYLFRLAANSLALMICQKTLFFDMVDIRD
jgi:glycosyltransferase involved in cell wall biosynthesis